MMRTYIDSYCGFIPCKVIGQQSDKTTIKVTGKTRGVYVKGNTYELSSWRIVPASLKGMRP